MRCEACNKKMNQHEMLAKNPITKDYENLCRTCINAVNGAAGGGNYFLEINYLAHRAHDPKGLYVPLSDEDSDN